MRNESVRGVFFDWDLTLARIMGEVPLSQRLTELFQRYDLALSAGQVRAAINQLDEAGDRPKPQTPTEIIEFYRQILQVLGYEAITPEFGQTLYDGYALLPNLLYDDAIPTLRRLAARPLRLGIISNHSVLARAMMEKLVGDFISAEQIIISDEVGLHKPDAGIYTLAAEKLDLPPAACALVGDNLEVDAIGAVEAGGFQRGFWLDRDGDDNDRRLPPGVTRITTLLDLRQHL